MWHRRRSRRSSAPTEAVDGVVPLSALETGEHAVVAELSASHGLLARMVSLGFPRGAPVVVVQNFGRGPLIVLVRDARIALGRGEARRIMVRRSGR